VITITRRKKAMTNPLQTRVRLPKFTGGSYEQGNLIEVKIKKMTKTIL
jgi:hypothetical protein